MLKEVLNYSLKDSLIIKFPVPESSILFLKIGAIKDFDVF